MLHAIVYSVGKLSRKESAVLSKMNGMHSRTVGQRVDFREKCVKKISAHPCRLSLVKRVTVQKMLNSRRNYSDIHPILSLMARLADSQS